MLQKILYISAGASIGAVLRWLLGLALNTVMPLIPLGTLLANLIGGYFIGVMLGLIALFPQFPAGARLFIITGFLGALTTFSSFSGEVVFLIQNRHIVAAVGLVGLHVMGSLVLTVLGILTAQLLVKLA